MAKADIKILVDWNNDGNFAHANSDITSDAIDLAWDRGRDYASQLSGNSKSGKLSATLYNTSGKYSPNNASSPTGDIMFTTANHTSADWYWIVLEMTKMA